MRSQSRNKKRHGQHVANFPPKRLPDGRTILICCSHQAGNVRHSSLLGILYHLPWPMDALRVVKSMSHEYILLDTEVYPSLDSVVQLRWEESNDIRKCRPRRDCRGSEQE